MEKKRKASKKAQVTIFIIIGIIIIVAGIVIFLLFRTPEDKSTITSPERYVESCISDNLEEAMKIVLEKGGSTNPELKILNKGQEITYLCYNQGHYNPCINQRPMLIEHLEQEINNYLKPRVEECFSGLRDNFQDRGYQVTMGTTELKTTLETKRIRINTKKQITLSGRGQVLDFKDFETTKPTSLYELAEIAMEITNQEAEYCNFENLGFMIIYPEYDIRKENVEGSLIYTITELETRESFKFATRGCVMPAGL